MTGDEVAEATAPAVTGISSGFMLDPATYTAGMAQGFAGMDFYFAGRAGVLGEVGADVVAAALVFFNREQVRSNWDPSAAVMPRSEAATLFAGCAETWAANHLGDGVDWDRLAELAGKVVEGATVAGAPVFAGWRAMPVPGESKAAALHQLNCLRELRMARHAVAILAGGVDPADAVRHHQRHMLGIFGWEDVPVADDVPERWARAERRTNEATGRDYAVLDSGETADFVRLTAQALEAVS